MNISKIAHFILFHYFHFQEVIGVLGKNEELLALGIFPNTWREEENRFTNTDLEAYLGRNGLIHGIFCNILICVKEIVIFTYGNS